MTTSEKTPEKKEDALQELMSKLEKEGMQKVQNLHQTNSCNIDTFT